MQFPRPFLAEGAPNPYNGRMPVLGVLGHTDHGKSTFLEKLTGVNPMHLPEERKRGLTIQLGFAYWTPPGAEQVTFIDVPGHERYLRNMLRGILGMDAAVLMVAADDGIMPGTLEHLRASLFAGFEHGMVLITKTDLVTPERVEEVRQELMEYLSGTLWEKAPVFPFAATKPDNLPEIKQALAQMAQDAGRRDEQPFAHYFIDRVFTIKGEGVVVTGTLRGQPVQVGDALHLFPEGREVRIRKLVQDNQEVERAEIHSRVGLNLSGIKREQVSTGDLLTSTTIKPSKGRHAALLAFPPGHLSEVKADWKRLEKRGPELNIIVGSALLTVSSLLIHPIDDTHALAFVSVNEDMPMMPGRRCIIYETAAITISCGGRLVDAPDYAGLKRRRKLEALTEAAQLIERSLPAGSDLLGDASAAAASAALRLVITHSLKLSERPQLSLLPGQLELDTRQRVAEGLEKDVYIVADGFVAARGKLAAEVEHAKRRLTEILDANPMAGPQELGKVVPVDAAMRLLPEAELARLFTQAGLEFAEGKVGVPGAGGGIPPKWRDTYERIKERFRGDPGRFPTLTVLKQDFPAASRLISELLASGELVHLGAGAVITGEIHEKWVAQIKQFLSRRGQISISEVKDLTRASRKYVIPLMEQLDKKGVTRRDGEVRKPGARFAE